MELMMLREPPGGVLDSWSPGVPVSRCPGVPVSQCPGVLVLWCPGVPVSRCPGVTVSRCRLYPLSYLRQAEPGGRTCCEAAPYWRVCRADLAGANPRFVYQPRSRIDGSQPLRATGRPPAHPALTRRLAAAPPSGHVTQTPGEVMASFGRRLHFYLAKTGQF